MMRVTALFLVTLLVLQSHGQDSQDIEAILQQHAAQIQQLQADLTAQQNQVASLTSKVTTLEAENVVLSTRLSVQERGVAFHVDMGENPYGEIQISLDDPVVFERTLLNVGEAYDNSTGVFTAPFPGVYSFTLYIMGPTGQHDDTEVGIFIANGTPQCVATAEGADHDTNDKGSCTAILQLDQGDQVFVKHNYGGQYLWGSLSTSFVGMLVTAQ